MITTLTTVGYGDISPENIYEQAMIIMIMIVGITIFSYVIGGFHSIIESFNQAAEVDDKLNELL
jgi:hypothetical protein